MALSIRETATSAVSLGAGFLLASVAPLVAQRTWVERHSAAGPPGATFAAAATDFARGRVVLFGGDEELRRAPTGETWEWDGVQWTERTPLLAPSPRSDAILVYDAARGRCVLFGGRIDRVQSGTNRSGPVIGDTWEWDGNEWSRVAVGTTPGVTAPVARHGHAAAWDAGRGVVVIHGGVDAAGNELGDTWEWDGATWRQRAMGMSPQARRDHAMAYDPSRGETVLYGGESGGQLLADTWSWNGTTWQIRFPSNVPPARRNHVLVYDLQRGIALMFGGVVSTGNADTWSWNGTDWQRLGPSPNRYGHTGAYDPSSASALAIAGWRDTGNTGGRETHGGLLIRRWDGNAWSTVDVVRPAVFHHAMVYDQARQRVVAFGGEPPQGRGTNGTWEWDGIRWTLRTVAVAPPRSTLSHAMAYDPVRQRTVYFGGTGRGNETWEWDGTTWQRMSTPTAPQARSRHAMAFDGRGVVLFGGEAVVGQNLVCLSDTWLWDGTSWLRSSATGPSARCGHAMSFDPVRSVVVMFGGFPGGSAQLHSDTWEWNGSSWSQASAAGPPPPRTWAAMAYDEVLQRMVLYGGSSVGGVLDDVWEYDGTTWTAVGPGPGRRSGHEMVWDGARRALLMLGGETQAPPGTTIRRLNGETWLRGATLQAGASTLGTGCSGGPPPPLLSSFGTPWIGNGSFALDLLRVPPQAPAALVFAAGSQFSSLPGGCTLWLDPAQQWALHFQVANRAGFASWPLPLAVNPAWLGLQLHAQAAALDPTGPVLGLSLSNGLTLAPGR